MNESFDFDSCESIKTTIEDEKAKKQQKLINLVKIPAGIRC